MSKEFRDLTLKSADLEEKRGLMRGGTNGAESRLRRFRDRESSKFQNGQGVRAMIAGERVDKLMQRGRDGETRYDRAQRYLSRRRYRGIQRWGVAQNGGHHYVD